MPAWWSWPLAILISEWVIRIVMTPIAVRRRRPSAASVWLAIIYFQPLVGFILYVLIGENRLPVRRIRLRNLAIDKVDGTQQQAAIDPHVMQPDLHPQQQPIVTLAERLTDLPILGGNTTEFLDDTNNTISKIIEDINNATDHVHILMYIYRNDDTGRRVAEALIKATMRGVTCRLLVDAVGSWTALRSILPQLREAGIHVEEALEVNFLRRGFARLDLRNHRKLIVIDGQIAYAGSQNIVDASYGHKSLIWHDLMARVTGPSVNHLQRIFEDDWYVETNQSLEGDNNYPHLKPTGSTPIQALPSGPTYPTSNYQRLVVTAIHAARRHITITSPYLVPDEPFLQALQVAVMRGVKVEVITPQDCDQIMVGAAGRAYRRDLLEIGVSVHLYQHGLLHAKTMTIDDEIALVGSGNFDMRSFYLNFELNLLLYGSDPTSKLRYIQKRYISQSIQLTNEMIQNRSRIKRTLEDTAKILSPLL